MPNLLEIIDVAIIGAGFSGTMVAANLLKQAKDPISVRIFDRDPRQFGCGVAYSSDMDCHLLNVPAANMSAYPDQPEHFLQWAQSHAERILNSSWVEDIGPKSFLPRRKYGEYLNWTLDEAEASAKLGVRLLRSIEKVVKIVVEADGIVRLRLADGETVLAKRAVLALGNFPPGNPAIADSGFYNSPCYHRNPWLPGLLPSLLESKSCLLIGSGLTMVDWAVTLDQAGYQGIIHVVSRRGFWPKWHQLGAPAKFTIDVQTSPANAQAWLRKIRTYIRETDSDWRPVIDALRPSSQLMWKSLSLHEQKRFLRHLRPFWDLHRHRLAPAIASRIETLVSQGKLIRHVGSVLEYKQSDQFVDVSIRQSRSKQIENIRVEAVVNCSGAESNYRRLESTLVRNLLQDHLICPDALGLGLIVAEDGALIDANGIASERLYTLGPPKKGMLWETTAVPELRGQAQQLATLLLDSLGISRV